MSDDATPVEGGARTRWGSPRARKIAAIVLLCVCVVGLPGLLYGLWRADAARRDAAQREQAQRTAAAVAALVVAQQNAGEWAQAAATAASEPSLPASLKANARLARYETQTLLDSNRLPFGQVFDVDWLHHAGGDARASTQPVLVTRGWYSGVATVQLGQPSVYKPCGVNAAAPQIRIASDGRWFAVQNVQSHETSLLLAPHCDRGDALLRDWTQRIAQLELAGRHVSAVLPLPGPRLLIGWDDGRVELLRAGAAPLAFPRLDAAAVGLYADATDARVMLLSRSGALRLVDPTGHDLAPPLALKRGSALATRDANWLGFVRGSGAATSRALQVVRGSADGRSTALLGVVAQPENVSFFLYDLPETEPELLDATVRLALDGACPRLDYLTADRLVSLEIDRRCAAQGAAPRSEIRLPRQAASSGEDRRGYASAAFCDGGTMVLGSWHGDVLWMRPLRASPGLEARVDIEHSEHGWGDPVTALACQDDGSVQAGFRAMGIKAYQPPLQLTERIVAVRTSSDYAHVIDDDQAWPVDMPLGPAKLQLLVDTGELGLLQQGRLSWRRRVVEPADTRPAAPQDKVTAVVVDAPRARVWALTTFGRVALVDLHTGAQLARFSTSYSAAAPSNEVALERPRLDAGGQFGFVHRIGDRAVKVVIEENAR